MDQKQPERLSDETSREVDALGPGFAWVYSAGPAGVGHALTVSGEGDAHRQLLAQFWCEQAPQIPGWTFYPSRQPGIESSLIFEIAGKRFAGTEIWVSPVADVENECMDLAVWHPEWATLENQQKWTILFLFLDEILGEYGTQSFVGKIEFGDTKLKEAIPLSELGPYVAQVRQERGWNEKLPGKSASLYKFDEPHDRYPRGDVIVGTTMLIKLLENYIESKGQLDDPLAGTGADYVYLQFEMSKLEAGKQLEERARLEDALDEALRKEQSGRLLGGALGATYAYIDLLLFDGEDSISVVERALRRIEAPSPVSLNYFAKQKRKLSRRLF